MSINVVQVLGFTAGVLQTIAMLGAAHQMLGDAALYFYPVAPLLAFIPLLGGALGAYAATVAWDWQWYWAAALFFGVFGGGSVLWFELEERYPALRPKSRRKPGNRYTKP